MKGTKKVVTLGDLRKALQKVPDNAQIVIDISKHSQDKQVVWTDILAEVVDHTHVKLFAGEICMS
jgi:hypothetical protein